MRDLPFKKYYFLYQEQAGGFMESRQDAVRCRLIKPEKPMTGEYNAGVPRVIQRACHYEVVVSFKGVLER